MGVIVIVIFQDIAEEFLKVWIAEEEFEVVNQVTEYAEVVQQIKDQFETVNAKEKTMELLLKCNTSYEEPKIPHTPVKGDKFSQHMEQLIKVHLFSIVVKICNMF